MRTIRIALLVAIAGRLFSQNAADDPSGWTKAKWGMTQDQLKEAFPQTTEIQEMNQMHLGLSSYVINHRKFAVAFTFDNDGGLSYVHLIDQKTLVGNDGTETPLVKCCPPVAVQSSPSRSSRKKASSPSAATAAFVEAGLNAYAAEETKDSLLSALTEKYGNPTNHTKELNGDRDSFEWLFPSSKIALIWFHTEAKQLDSTDLFYSLRKRSSDL